ncbi:Dopamine N-acetyltransferase-like Protein [Tribolium castaneum]|uniref:aralkylamine N-acetyltransferase n=2 Tax=Tribolium castaneum TaxID=7070 RepID=A0A139WJ51_TRICA|nr:Dopamine N-acetyltransferase-like Protein [Tribolium castaneum]
MAVQMQPSFILTEKFEKLKFTDFVSVDSVSTPSTPSTPCSPPAEPFSIEVITAGDADEVLRFLRCFFIRDEPLNHSIGLLDGKETCPELESYSIKDLDSGLNLKAVSNGKIIGVCLNGILTRGYLEEIEEANCEDKKFESILRLLDHVAVQSDIFSHFPDVDKAMVVKILSVDSSLRGRGIAKDLMNRTRDLARELGCGIMTADCTSHFTARALKKLGFECIYSLNYEDYKVNGEVVFTPETPHAAVTVYTQRIVK